LFDVNRSQRQASERLARVSVRRRRSDAGRLRLPEVVLAEIRAAALGDDRPSMAALQHLVSERCRAAGLKALVRASLFQIQVGSLLTPPMRRLKIQTQTADVAGR
jgi:hypothetical protein